MKLLNKISACLMGTIMIASCSNDDSFTPGQEAGSATGASNCGVYFVGDYDSQTIIGDEPTPEDTLWFELGRKDTLEAIDVPIIVESKAACISVPKSVHFEVGDTTAWLGITYVGAVYGEDSKFVLRIDDAYANPYAQKEGTTRLESSILRSQWIDVCDTLIFSSSNKTWPDQGCKLQRLEGQKRLRFTNFIGSGKPLEFGLRSGWNDKDLYQSKGEFNPLSNYYDGGSIWYFTNGGNYDPWTPQGSDKTISWMYFWAGSNYTFIDMVCDIATASDFKWGDKTYYCDYYYHYSLMTAWIVYADGTSNWDYLYLYLGYKKEDE